MNRLAAGVLVVCAGLLNGAGDQPEEPEPDWGAIRHELDDGMARLAPLIGHWWAEGSMGRAGAGGVAAPQRGIWSNRWLMEGKHLELSFDVVVGEGEAARPMQWLAIISYNPFRDQYESMWIGSSGYRFAETGTFDDRGRLVLTALQDGPDLSNPTTNVSVFEFHDDGTITVTDTQTDRDTPEPVVSFFVRLTRS